MTSSQCVEVQLCGERVTVTCDVDTNVVTVGSLAIEKLNQVKPTFLSRLLAPHGVQVLEFRRNGSLIGADDSVEDYFRDGAVLQLVFKGERTRTYSQSRSERHSVNGSTNGLHDVADALRDIQGDVDRLDLDLEPRTPPHTLVLDGSSLNTRLLLLASKANVKVQVATVAQARIRQSRRLLDQIVENNQVVYGVSTGFGDFANVRVPNDQLKDLQENLIRSHACGVGPALSLGRVRRMLALRINVLAKGYSGVSWPNVEKLVNAFNACCLPRVPEQGTVGCSGDLAPLAHLALGMMGEGRMWSPKTGWADAATVLKQNGLEALELGPKEGIALINGTQMVSSMGAEAVERASAVCRQADVIAALTIEVLKGTTTAFDIDVHRIRPHAGQNLVAERLRALLHSEANPSEIAESHRFCGRVQDAYSLRCVPQVHGVVHDTIEFVRSIINNELNSATDNPLVFADRGEIISGGNFHGEYPAKALDYLAIAVHELGAISERRLERLVNTHLSQLPAFLTKQGGLNSGFMMVQVTAASLVSENKVLCHPASCDSIPTSGNQEDHVSMGGFAARKCLQVLQNVEMVLATELLGACQGMEFLDGLQSTTPLHSVYRAVRDVSAPIERDRFMAPEMDAVWRLLRTEKIWSVVKNHLDRMKNLELEDPEALRLGSAMESPTGWKGSPVTTPYRSRSREASHSLQ